MENMVDFTAFPDSKLEQFILKKSDESRVRVPDAAVERRKRLNNRLTIDEEFINHFEVINNRLTELMDELFDKMLDTKKSFSKLIQENKSPFDEYYLTGTIIYEDRDVDYAPLPEILTKIELSGKWSLLVSNEHDYLTYERDRERLLLKNFNWDIEVFDLSKIRARNIQVCYMMHSLFCDGFLSLGDLMAMKPNNFFLSIEAWLN